MNSKSKNRSDYDYEVVWHGAIVLANREKGELLPPRLTPISVGVLVNVEDDEERALL